MARDICPSCGAPYNGKRCRTCNYQPLDANMTRTCKGKIQTEDASKRKRSSRKNRFGDQKRKTTAGSLIGFLIILVLIALMLPILRNWGLELEAMEASQSISEPAPRENADPSK